MKSMKSMKLHEIAWVYAGYSFREVIEDTGGYVGVVQMKNVHKNIGIQWNSIVHTDLRGRAKPNWLETGQVLFVARGNHNFAIFLEDVPRGTICSPHFYQIIVKDESLLNAKFLSWWINQRPAQKYLETFAEGSTTLSIRREILENLTVAIPPLAEQNDIILLDRSFQEERVIFEQLHENNMTYMTVLAYGLVKKIP